MTARTLLILRPSMLKPCSTVQLGETPQTPGSGTPPSQRAPDEQMSKMYIEGLPIAHHGADRGVRAFSLRFGNAARELTWARSGVGVSRSVSLRLLTPVRAMDSAGIRACVRASRADWQSPLTPTVVVA